ncbi:MAG: DNA repair protein RecN, partial [Clostridia bacterium]|nr:DNA repair protein RecN [Clostridia bacterium]
MLNCLHIENIAVIENADVSLSGGFNVLTGETGAGKSIIIDSLNAVLGARASKDLIRNGTDSARVVAEFSDIGVEAERLLEEYGLSSEDGKVIIQRILTLDSRGGFRINSQPVAASVVRDIGVALINIHGQHDNQTLLNPDKHCDYIDKIAENSKEREEYLAEFKNLNSIRRELQELDFNEEEKLRRIDLLKFQINELEKADIKVGEFEALKEKLKLAKQFEQNSKRINSVLDILCGAEGDGATEQLRTAHKLLCAIESEKLNTTCTRLASTLEDLMDIESEVRFFGENELISAENIDLIQDRIDFLRSLMLKYSGDEAGMLNFLESARRELENINSSDKKIAELEEKLSLSEQRLIKKGEQLSLTRARASKVFQENVCNILRLLDMPNVAFVVKHEKDRYSKKGCDNIEFLISANAGESVKPLAKIASGGELSRVMLAIKSVLSTADEVSTLIFDEIDSGLSGRAANKVAAQIRKVSADKQVICVTHLAQIAAAADTHLLIEKSVDMGRTYTRVTELDYNNRITEIARIMSGTEITDKLFDS